MSIAQRLMKNGWITYMRTDSPSLSEQAIKAARTLIVAEFGQPNLPKYPVCMSQNQRGTGSTRGHSTRLVSPLSCHHRPTNSWTVIWHGCIFDLAAHCCLTDGKCPWAKVSVSIQVKDGVFTASGKSYNFYGFRRAYVKGLIIHFRSWLSVAFPSTT